MILSSLVLANPGLYRFRIKCHGDFFPKVQPNAGTSTVHAKKLVIVTCGALGTPSVLERSGVGSSEVLQKAGIEVVANLPGVGSNY